MAEPQVPPLKANQTALSALAAIPNALDDQRDALNNNIESISESISKTIASVSGDPHLSQTARQSLDALESLNILGKRYANLVDKALGFQTHAASAAILSIAASGREKQLAEAGLEFTTRGFLDVLWNDVLNEGFKGPSFADAGEHFFGFYETTKKNFFGTTRTVDATNDFLQAVIASDLNIATKLLLTNRLQSIQTGEAITFTAAGASDFGHFVGEMLEDAGTYVGALSEDLQNAVAAANAGIADLHPFFTPAQQAQVEVLETTIQTMLGAGNYLADRFATQANFVSVASAVGTEIDKSLIRTLLPKEEFLKISGTMPVASQKLLLTEVYGDALCFLAGTEISMWDGSQKPIEDIAPGDMVTSYNADGILVAGEVTKLFRNHVTQILDVFGLQVTPGHVTLCGDGIFAGMHVPIIDILRSDGAVVREDGTKVRVATNAAVGSEMDAKVWAVAGTRHPDGSLIVTDRGQLRLGQRFITEDGEDLCLADIIERAGATIKDDLIVTKPGELGVPFLWPFGETLPRPEDFVLQRSASCLSGIYAAGEWEDVPSVLAAPGLPQSHAYQ